MSSLLHVGRWWRGTSKFCRWAKPRALTDVRGQLRLLASLALLCVAGCSASQRLGSTHGCSASPSTAAPTNSFAIYFTAEPTTFAPTGNWSRVQLNLPPVIADSDVVAVDLGGAIKLRRGVIKRLPDPLSSGAPAGLLQGIPFVCVVNGERLFPGVFWTGLSSFGPPADAMIMLDRLPRQDYLVLQWIKREPGAVCPWSDPRVRTCLEGLHKLGRVEYP